MKQSIFTILENSALTRDVFRMVLEGDTSAITASGQFVNILLEGRFLRRPISVCDWSDTTLTIVYKVVGHGTEDMCKMAPRPVRMSSFLPGAILLMSSVPWPTTL